MTALAQRCGAINLGQGFPDTDGPDWLLAAARGAIGAGANQYPPLAGVPELRLAISRQRAERYQTAYCPDSEVAVTAGATEAVAAALLGLCEPGDEVVLFEPYYDAYAAVIAMAGAVRRPVLLRPGRDGVFGFDPAEMRAAVTPRTRLLLLNSPHNPTGKVFARSELETIAALCRRHDLVALTDEVYEYLAYDGAAHVPLASLPGMRERTLAVSSAGKTFSVTGWKIGWACGPEPLIRALLAAKQYLRFAGGTPFQLAVAVGLEQAGAWSAELRASLRQRRDLLRRGLAAAGLPSYPCQGGYFLQADVRPAGFGDATAFCRYLTEQAGVAAIPSAAFYDAPGAGRAIARFAFCKREDEIRETSARLAAAPWPTARAAG